MTQYKIKEYVINMDMRFENKIYRFERSLTNKDIHRLLK